MFNIPGGVSLIFTLLFFSGVLGSLAFEGVNMATHQQIESNVGALMPYALSQWKSDVGDAIAAAGTVNAAIPPPQSFTVGLCTSENASCGLTGTVTYTGTSGTGGSVTTYVANENKGAGVYCDAAENYAAGFASLTVTNAAGSVLATRRINLQSRLICASPYVASTAVSDDGGRVLNVTGFNRVADTGGGCDPTSPSTCDNLAQAGESGQSDTRVHAYLECAGAYCTGSDALQSVDSFQQKQVENGETAGAPR